MAATVSDVSRPISVTADAKAKAAGRLLYVDNIRVYLTFLVILHHLMITYAGTGSWYYNEGRQDFITNAVGGWFCAVNQAYFMGLFLLISAYFVPGSYDRKGAGRFLLDRLVRLGIPLAIFSWVINPLFIYLGLTLSGESVPPLGRFLFFDYYRQYGPILGAGPLWFVETLLIFSAVYVIWRLLARSRPAKQALERPFPSNLMIPGAALLLGVAGFGVRLVFPMNQYNFEPLNLQFPFFGQYIALFILGLVAYRRNWLAALPDATGRFWLRIAAMLIVIWAPMALLLDMPDNMSVIEGGWHWQALVYAIWESLTCFSMVIGVTYFFRRYANRQGGASRFLSRNAYTAYIIHAPIITSLAFMLSGIMLYPLLKWAVLAPVALALCFGVASLVRKIPGTERVL